MAISIQIEPNEYMAAYSAIPLKFQSTNVNDAEDFKYIINICYDSQSANSPTATVVGTNVWTKITAPAYPYSEGDTILIIDSDDTYTGYYTLKEETSSNQFIIDMVITTPVTGTLTCQRVIKYKILPDLDGYCKVDLSNTLKDFVTQDLDDDVSILSAPNTEFQYTLYLGEEKRYSVEFEDNGSFYPTYGGNGKVSFWNSSITSLTGVQLSVGDKITISQNLQSWSYNGTYNDSGYLAFSATSAIHNFRVGQQITVNGQVTEPSYNGVTNILSVDAFPSSTKMTVNKAYSTSVPLESGKIYGTPIPEYNTTCTITDINIDGTYGLVISTDIDWENVSQPISGTITFAENTVIQSLTEDSITGLTVYNAHLNKLDYEISGFTPYVVTTTTTASEQSFSTILDDAELSGSSNAYRVEKTSKGWLLAHQDITTTSARAMFYGYDSDGALLTQSRLNYPGAHDTSFMVPIGLSTISGSSYTNITGSTLSTVVDDIATYKIALCNSSNSIKSKFVTFEVNNDCSRFEMYHLMWKDRYGSWLTYPFKYMSKNITEFDRKTYYKLEGEWGASSFGYDTYDRGEKSYFGRSRDKVVLNSGWVEEFENVLIKDLLESTSVYLQKPDGNLIGCIIEQKSQEFFKKNNVDLYQYMITVRLSSNEVRY